MKIHTFIQYLIGAAWLVLVICIAALLTVTCPPDDTE